MEEADAAQPEAQLKEGEDVEVEVDDEGVMMRGIESAGIDIVP